MKIILAVFLGLLSILFYTFTYTYLIARFAPVPNVKAVDISVLYTSPLYWLLMLLMIGGEVLLWRRLL